MSAPICFTDCETLSLRPGRQAWEIAVIRRVDDARDERVWIVAAEDLDLSQADPKSLEINRFYERHPDMNGTATYGDNGPQYGPESWVMQDIEEWTRGAHIVGINPAFDMDTLDARMRAHRKLPAWDYHPNDVRAMAIGWLHGLASFDGHECARGRRSFSAETGFTGPPDVTWRTDDIAKACGVDPAPAEYRHTALGDAAFAERWFYAITGGGIS